MNSHLNKQTHEKKDLIVFILSSIFGKDVKNIIEENYNNDKDLIKLAYHMLCGYMGKDNAKKLLLKEKLIKPEDIKSLDEEYND